MFLFVFVHKVNLSIIHTNAFTPFYRGLYHVQNIVGLGILSVHENMFCIVYLCH